MRGLVRVSLLGTLVACGSKAREPRTHQVEIRAMQYVPAELTVAAGDTIVWTNTDIVPHTVTAIGTLDSQQIDSKRQWQTVVMTKGELSYGCTFHPTMHGKLVVR